MKKVLFFFILGLTLSCNNRNNQSVENASLETYVDSGDETDENECDIEIGVKAFIEDDNKPNADNDDEDLSYKSYKKDNCVYIEPTCKYFDSYRSSSRMELQNEEISGPACGLYTYPIVELFIVNNTEETLNINELDVEINKSELDDFPYLYLYKNYELSYCLPICNEAWGNWGDMILEYSLLKKGESFSGKYIKKRIIPYFKDYALVDFASDIKAMGLDESAINPNVSFYDGQEWLINHSVHILRNDESVRDFQRFGQFDVNSFDYREMEDIFYPFEVSDYLGSYYGYARLFGRISFTKHNFSKQFKTQILITFPGEGGAGEDLDDNFDVHLEVNKIDYEIKLPYVTKIDPHGSERIRLHVRCDKSSHHSFVVKAKNTNDVRISTPNIQLYYLNSRHSYMNMHSDNIGDNN